MAQRKDFDIEIREELSRTVTVKAETLGDAINQVMDQYKRGWRRNGMNCMSRHIRKAKLRPFSLSL